MTPNQQVRNRIARTAMELLAELPEGEGLHKETLWDRVQERYPSVMTDWAEHVRGQSAPLIFLQWRSSGMVHAGWLHKDGNGYWCITGAGRVALRERADLAEWAAELDWRYQRWSKARDRFELGESLLSSLAGGTWVAASDLASRLTLPADLLTQRLVAIRPEGWHRLRDADGEPPRQAHLTQSERMLVEKLAAADGTTDQAGHAYAHQRLQKADLHLYLADSEDALAGNEEPVRRRAWLVRGSNVQGKNLVRSLWLPEGICSLPASRLRELPSGSGRDEVAAAVEQGYAHLGAAERSAMVLEYHAFLNRIHTDDLVLTNDGSTVYAGTVAGPAGFTVSHGDRANLQRPVTWRNTNDPHDYEDLTGEVANRLANPNASVIDLTEFLGELERLFDDEPGQSGTERVFALPDADEALAKDLHIDREWLQECVELLRDRSQLVFYGPPGTGKTYIAQALAHYLAGRKPENVQLVQFHPAYSYDDFFEGYRPRPAPNGLGISFELVWGPLRTLADAAHKRPDEPFVLIIDEINRGNLAKIFGELYLLLEYRDRSVHLLYGSDKGLGFTLPKNIVILATMNTADRSIAPFDAAMRRRFWFMELDPGSEPASLVLGRWLAERGLPDEAVRLLAELNRRIGDPEFRVGPSYLMSDSVYAHPRGFERVWRHQLLPLLAERHYGDGTDIEATYGLDSLRAAVAGTEEEASEDQDG